MGIAAPEPLLDLSGYPGQDRGDRGLRGVAAATAATAAVAGRHLLSALRALPARWSVGSAAAYAAGMRSTLIAVRTGNTETVRDITGECSEFVRQAGGDGLLHVFVPHATAGVAIIELGAHSDDDLLAALRDLLPADDRWRHAHGSRGHGRSHVLPALIAPYATVPVLDGELALGTWQSLALVDVNVDNPDRQVRLSFLASAG